MNIERKRLGQADTHLQRAALSHGQVRLDDGHRPGRAGIAGQFGRCIAVELVVGKPRRIRKLQSSDIGSCIHEAHRDFNDHLFARRNVDADHRVFDDQACCSTRVNRSPRA